MCMYAGKTKFPDRLVLFGLLCFFKKSNLSSQFHATWSGLAIALCVRGTFLTPLRPFAALFWDQNWISESFVILWKPKANDTDLNISLYAFWLTFRSIFLAILVYVLEKQCSQNRVKIRCFLPRIWYPCSNPDALKIPGQRFSSNCTKHYPKSFDSELHRYKHYILRSIKKQYQ